MYLMYFIGGFRGILGWRVSFYKGIKKALTMCQSEFREISNGLSWVVLKALGFRQFNRVFKVKLRGCLFCFDRQMRILEIFQRIAWLPSERFH